MKDLRSDALTAASVGIFGAVHLADINQLVSIMVGLGTLVALGIRIRGLTKGNDHEED